MMDFFEDNGLFQDKPEYSDEVAAEVDEQMKVLITDYLTSDVWQEKPLVAKDKDAENILEATGEMMYIYHREVPGQWTDDAMADVLTYYFPAKVIMANRLFSKIAKVTAGFVQFYGTKVAKSPDMMIETIKDSHDLIRENAKMWQ